MVSTKYETWHNASGQACGLHTLQTDSGYRLDVLDYGATVVRLCVPDRTGKSADIVLGYDSLDDYQSGTFFLGATCGRVANRIAEGRCKIGDQSLTLAQTDPPHHLHGGVQGWDKVFWNSRAEVDGDAAMVSLTYESPDGEEGYPGKVVAQTIYTLTESGLLRIAMSATTEALTAVNMAHHSYFNLRGHDTGDVSDHLLTLYCDEYTPSIVPDGTTASVEGTVFDFRKERRLGDSIAQAQGTPPGLDQNLIVRGEPHTLRPVARVADPGSGRIMTIAADQPGLQLYTGNYLDGKGGGKGALHRQHGAFCLETQAFPNAINVPKWQDQVLLDAGKEYRHTMVFQFENGT